MRAPFSVSAFSQGSDPHLAPILWSKIEVMSTLAFSVARSAVTSQADACPTREIEHVNDTIAA